MTASTHRPHRYLRSAVLLSLALGMSFSCSRFEDPVLPEKDAAFKKYFGGNRQQEGLTVEPITTGYVVLGNTNSYEVEDTTDFVRQPQALLLYTDAFGDEANSVLVGEADASVSAVQMLLENEAGDLVFVGNKTKNDSTTIVMYAVSNQGTTIEKTFEFGPNTVVDYGLTGVPIRDIEANDLIMTDEGLAILATVNPGTNTSQVAVLKEDFSDPAKPYIMYLFGFADGETANAFTTIRLSDGSTAFSILATTREQFGTVVRKKMSVLLLSFEGQNLADIVIDDDMFSYFDLLPANENNQTLTRQNLTNNQQTGFDILPTVRGADITCTTCPQDVLIFGSESFRNTSIVIRLSINNARTAAVQWGYWLNYGGQNISPVKITELQGGSFLLLSNTITGVAENNPNSDFLLDRITRDGNSVSAIWPRFYGGTGDDFAGDIKEVSNVNGGYVIVGNVTLAGDNTLINLIKTNPLGEIAN